VSVGIVPNAFFEASRRCSTDSTGEARAPRPCCAPLPLHLCSPCQVKRRRALRGRNPSRNSLADGASMDGTFLALADLRVCQGRTFAAKGSVLRRGVPETPFAFLAPRAARPQITPCATVDALIILPPGSRLHPGYTIKRGTR
jgi:hypothetical protein